MIYTAIYLEISVVGTPRSSPKVKERIYIPQNPNGRAKELAIFDTNSAGNVRCVNYMTDKGCEQSTYLEVGYKCDTESGSSGAPVLSEDSHKVIDLHHCGGSCDDLGVPITEISK